MRSDRISPLPGPGVFATSSSNATPALLPDGSIAPGSVSDLVEFSESERVANRFRSGGSVTEIESAEHPSRADDELVDGRAGGWSNQGQAGAPPSQEGDR
jgi:NADH-quinone oxidoreductase subunit J